MPGSYTPAQLQAMARQTALTYGLDPSIFMGLVEKESTWTINATNSRTSAFGLTQMTNAAQIDVGVTRSGLFDNAKAQLDAGAAYLKQQLNRFGNYGDALAAYNQGAGNVGNSAGNAYAKDVMDRAGHYMTLADGKSLLNQAGDMMHSILNYDLGKAAEGAIDDATGGALSFNLEGWFGRIALGLFALILIAAALFMLAPNKAKALVPLPV